MSNPNPIDKDALERAFSEFLDKEVTAKFIYSILEELQNEKKYKNIFVPYQAINKKILKKHTFEGISQQKKAALSIKINSLMKIFIDVPCPKVKKLHPFENEYRTCSPNDKKRKTETVATEDPLQKKAKKPKYNLDRLKNKFITKYAAVECLFSNLSYGLHSSWLREMANEFYALEFIYQNLNSCSDAQLLENQSKQLQDLLTRLKLCHKILSKNPVSLLNVRLPNPNTFFDGRKSAKDTVDSTQEDDIDFKTDCGNSR